RQGEGAHALPRRVDRAGARREASGGVAGGGAAGGRPRPPAAAAGRGRGPGEKLGGEWLAGGPQAAAAGLRLPPRAVVSVRAQVVTEFRETLATIGETLAALEQRLTGIERQLGITPPAPEDADQSSDAAAEGPD